MRLLEGYKLPLYNELISGFNRGFPLHYQGPATQRHSSNHPSATNQPEIVSSLLAVELQNDRIAGPFVKPPLPNFVVSPLGLVPKRPQGFRLIHNLSFPRGQSVNDFIPQAYSSVSYQDFDHAIRIITTIGRNCLIAKADIQSAFRNLPISPQDYNLLGFQWEGLFYYDRTLPMGCSVSCRTFELLSNALEWALKKKFHISHVSHILDDFMFFGPPSTPVCHDALHTFLNITAEINLPVKHSKTVFPTTVAVLHGIEVDTGAMQAKLPQEKLDSAKTLLQAMHCRKSVFTRCSHSWAP